eukprot:CAMPEP_0194308832 /NCGR_PEP_ID=MMETSP0171-20130528/5787_1 /TAXON_ID=218684 /ORGANISM="Corethron pennatum, Strain L29A3" /LENGTH=871 /DNA_ID=CAMNT_0039061659 /DNA_START=145 /DNA_END=2761 /DNA_ORIENTATION=-
MKRQRSIPGPSFHAATAAAAAIFLLLSAPSLATELSRVRVSHRRTQRIDSAPKVRDATLKDHLPLMRQTQETFEIKKSSVKSTKAAEKAKGVPPHSLSPSTETAGTVSKNNEGALVQPLSLSKHPTASKESPKTSKARTEVPKAAKQTKTSKKETKTPETAPNYNEIPEAEKHSKTPPKGTKTSEKATKSKHSKTSQKGTNTPKKASKYNETLTPTTHNTASKKSGKGAYGARGKVKCKYSNVVKEAKRRLDNDDQDVFNEKYLRTLKKAKKMVLDGLCGTNSTGIHTKYTKIPGKSAKTKKAGFMKSPENSEMVLLMVDDNDPNTSDPNASESVAQPSTILSGNPSPQKPKKTTKVSKGGVVFLAVVYETRHGIQFVKEEIQSRTENILKKGSKGDRRVLLDRTEDILLPSRTLENEAVTFNHFNGTEGANATEISGYNCPEETEIGSDETCLLFEVGFSVYVNLTVDEVDDGNKTIVDGIETIVDGIETVADGNETVVDGNETVVDSNETVVDGNDAVDDGNETAVGGSETVVDGNETVVDGNETVDNGIKAVDDGNETAGQLNLDNDESVSTDGVPANIEPSLSNSSDPGASVLYEGNKLGSTVDFGTEPNDVESTTEADTVNTNVVVSESASPTSISDQAASEITFDLFPGGVRRKLQGQESGMVGIALRAIESGTNDGEFLEENSGITNVVYLGNIIGALSRLKADASPSTISNSSSWITWMVVALAVVAILVLSFFTFRRAKRINDITSEKSLRKDFYDDCEHDLALDVTSEDFDNSMDDDITMSTNHSRPYEAEVGNESQYMDSHKNGNNFQAEVRNKSQNLDSHKNENSFQPADPYNLAKKSSGVDSISAPLHHVICVGILQE